MPDSSSQSYHPSYVTWGILGSCRRALKRLFRVPASAALSIRAFRFRNLRKAAARMSPRRHRRRKFRSVRAVFWPLVVPPSYSSSTLAASAEEVGDAVRVEPVPEAVVMHETPVHVPVSSPETPTYVKVVARLRSGRSAGSSGDGEAEDEKEEACRSFESSLVEMLVEEAKARDLQDVEELLWCWERLKSPVFVELVCRFYGELCNDMFPAAGVHEAVVDGGDGEGEREGEGSVSTPAVV